MALHLIKLCVGADSIADLEGWIAGRVRGSGRHVHTTRMMPKRRDELIEGGSLYWVIRGILSCRQPILDLTQRTDAEGIQRCDVLLEPVVVPVEARPRGPFQGWRYLASHEAPPDLSEAARAEDLPPALQRELRTIGVI